MVFRLVLQVLILFMSSILMHREGAEVHTIAPVASMDKYEGGWVNIMF